MVRTVAPMKDYYDETLQDFFESLERKCEEGQFEEDAFVEPASVSKREQRCCYFPLCNMMTSQCNGYTTGMCIEVNSGRVKLPSLEELERSTDRPVAFHGPAGGFPPPDRASSSAKQ